MGGSERMSDKRTKEDLRELQALPIESGHTCGECEYFGDGKYPVVKYFVDGELKSVFVGFSDRPHGEACCFFAHKCDLKNNIVTYENSQSCKDFVPKTWKRPETCAECSRYKHHFDNGFSCSGHPVVKVRKGSDKACPNGKCKGGEQYSLFDY